MQSDILEEAQRLIAEQAPFALATVVVAHQPASGTPGARAIVLRDGTVRGWIGGHCAQPAVVRQGLQALADGQPRLLVLNPDGAAPAVPTPGVVNVPMLCASQGELQIFVEPFLPKIEVVVVGASPVARTLAHLAVALDFRVCACDADATAELFPDATRLVPEFGAIAPTLAPHQYVVIATIGAYDEEAALAALQSGASYVGLVASRTRFQAVRSYLAHHGISEERIAQLRRPQGLPEATLQPAEIALSVLVELVEQRRQRVGLAPPNSDTLQAAPAPAAEAVDPVCGMTVTMSAARYSSERDGVRYYFCCAGCQETFERASAGHAEHEP